MVQMIKRNKGEVFFCLFFKSFKIKGFKIKTFESLIKSTVRKICS